MKRSFVHFASHLHYSFLWAGSKILAFSVRRVWGYLVFICWGLYRVGIRPFFQGHCRFSPSCSTYAREALCQHSLPLALFLIIKRVIRCYPGQWAYDPVPLPPLPRRSWKTKKIF